MGDSAYGSPTLMSPFTLDEDEQWKYMIYPQDIETISVLKPHIKDRLDYWFDPSWVEPVETTDYLFDPSLAETPFVRQRSKSEAFEEPVEFVRQRTQSLSAIKPKCNKESGKPFKCDMCSASFGRNHDLKRHVR